MVSYKTQPWALPSLLSASVSSPLNTRAPGLAGVRGIKEFSILLYKAIPKTRTKLERKMKPEIRAYVNIVISVDERT